MKIGNIDWFADDASGSTGMIYDTEDIYRGKIEITSAGKEEKFSIKFKDTEKRELGSLSFTGTLEQAEKAAESKLEQLFGLKNLEEK